VATRKVSIARDPLVPHLLYTFTYRLVGMLSSAEFSSCESRLIGNKWIYPLVTQSGHVDLLLSLCSDGHYFPHNSIL